jgi:hypothetical protein
MITPTQIPQQKTPIQLPRDDWFVPMTRQEIDWAAEDPAYAGFLKVSRYIGAWASVFPAERRGWFLLDVPSVVYVPLADTLPAEADGDARAKGQHANGREVEVDFEFVAKLTVIEQGFARYEVTVKADAEHEYQG